MAQRISDLSPWPADLLEDTLLWEAGWRGEGKPWQKQIIGVSDNF